MLSPAKARSLGPLGHLSDLLGSRQESCSEQDSQGKNRQHDARSRCEPLHRHRLPESAEECIHDHCSLLLGAFRWAA